MTRRAAILAVVPLAAGCARGSRDLENVTLVSATPREAVKLYADLFFGNRLLEASFYSNENLRRIFGQSPQRRDHDSIFGSDHLLLDAKVAAGDTRLSAILLGRRVLNAALRVQMSGLGILYEDVSALCRFDDLVAERQPPVVPHHPLNLPPRTHPHGNESLSFVLKRQDATWSMACSFGADGRLRDLSVMVENPS